MAITPLPPLDRTATSFKSDTDTFFGTLVPTFCTEANALASGMNAIAAGTAFAIPYTFSTTTTDADPGAGVMRLDSATQNAATTIRLDLVGADAATYTGLIDAFDDSSSVVKGQIILQKLGDATKWLAFNLTALASPSGYKNLTVANIASSASSPFANGDSLILKFTRSGDKGETGAAIAPYLNIRDQKSSGTAAQNSNGSAEVNRELNTVVVNGISGASLASNTITLPAGTYQIKARCPIGNASANKAYLYNSTDSSYTIVGSSSGVNGSGISIDSWISGQFTILGTKNFLIKHYAVSTAAMGIAVSSGQIEVYTEVEIWKIS